MSKQSRKKRRPAEPSRPDWLGECSRCGRPWIRVQLVPIRGDNLCQACYAEWKLFQIEVTEMLEDVARFDGKLAKARLN